MISYFLPKRITSFANSKYRLAYWLFVFICSFNHSVAVAQSSYGCNFVIENNRLRAIRIPVNLPAVARPADPKIYFGQLDSIAPKQVAMLGDGIWQKDTFQFTPKFSLLEDQYYTIQINEKHTLTCKSPLINKRVPQLLAVYPSNTQVPANLLKIYLQFNEPMQVGKTREQVYLLNHQRDTLKGVFLELQPELWNEDYTRVTLWLDPGRIKRALGPNQDTGSPLVKGENYTLIVSKAWKNHSGRSLAKDYQKKIEVLPPNRSKIEINNWRLEIPTANTNFPIHIYFDRPLDHALLQKSFSVWDSNEQQIASNISIGDKEQQLSIHPNEKWIPGIYKIRVNSALEDVAGNNLNRSFDVDLSKENDTSEVDYFWIEIQIK